MAAGPNITTRGFNSITDPKRFLDYPARRYAHLASKSEVTLFDSQNNSTGSIMYSEMIAVNSTEGFSFFIDSATSGNVIIEASYSAVPDFWVALDTVSGGGLKNYTQQISVVRVGLANGVTNATVVLYRKFSTY